MLKLNRKAVLVSSGLATISVVVVLSTVLFVQSGNNSEPQESSGVEVVDVYEVDKDFLDSINNEIEKDDKSDLERADLFYQKALQIREEDGPAALESYLRAIELAPEANPDYYLQVAYIYRQEDTDDMRFREYVLLAKELAENNPELEQNENYIKYLLYVLDSEEAVKD